MADDTLTSLGQKLTDLFAARYAGGNPNVSLGFLPFCAAVPDDIEQGGLINPTRMAAFLTANFDFPFVLAPGQNTAFGQDPSYGPASQIYSTAVTLARSAMAPGSDAAKRLNAEIVMAQSVLSPAGVTAGMTCQPDDWVATENSSYWTAFDSTQVQTQAPSTASTPATPGTGPASAPVRVLNPQVWSIRPQIAAPAPSGTTPRSASPLMMRAVNPAVNVISAQQVLAAPAGQNSPDMAATPAPAVAVVSQASPAVSISAARPMLASAAAPMRPVNGVIRDWPDTVDVPVRPVGRPIHVPIDPQPVATDPPPPPPPPSSKISIHFAYMSVSVGYTAAGLSIWDGVFLADQGWYVSGMARGGLLPSPNFSAGATPLVYGLPISLIIVRDVTISVQWSGEDQASLGTSGGFLGPFSLSGISPSVAPDGTWTYARPGLQVVAVLCSHLPVVPPLDAPDLAPPAPAAGAPATTASAEQTPPTTPVSGTPTPATAAPAGDGATQTTQTPNPTPASAMPAPQPTA